MIETGYSRRIIDKVVGWKSTLQRCPGRLRSPTRLEPFACAVIRLENGCAFRIRRKNAVFQNRVPAAASGIWATASGETDCAIGKTSAFLKRADPLLALDDIDDRIAFQEFSCHEVSAPLGVDETA
jgi:hypothetical protein